MKYSALFLLLFSTLFPLALCADKTQKENVHTLECNIIEKANKLIRCTYYTQRKPDDRNITFTWRSATTPQDDREHTGLLKANHGSLYDYRYYYGRAYGLWDITVTDDEDNVLSTTSFTVK